MSLGEESNNKRSTVGFWSATKARKYETPLCLLIPILSHHNPCCFGVSCFYSSHTTEVSFVSYQLRGLLFRLTLGCVEKNSLIILKQIKQKKTGIQTIQQQFCPNRLYASSTGQTLLPQAHVTMSSEIEGSKGSVVNTNGLGLFAISWSHVRINNCPVKSQTEEDWWKGSETWICWLIHRSLVTCEQHDLYSMVMKAIKP